MKKTILHDWHKAQGAVMVPFGGWEMPVSYTSLSDEHKAVREAAGLFDISHMGQVMVRGAKALEFLQAATSNDINGNAVITLGGGDTVTLTGFSSASLQIGDVILTLQEPLKALPAVQIWIESAGPDGYPMDTDAGYYGAHHAFPTLSNYGFML